MQRDVKNDSYGIVELTEKSHHQHHDWRLGKVKWLSIMIGGSYTMALVRACNDIIIIMIIIIMTITIIVVLLLCKIYLKLNKHKILLKFLRHNKN